MIVSVSGYLKQANTAPWSNASVSFNLEQSLFLGDAEIAPYSQGIAKTDKYGKVQFELYQKARYKIRLPNGESFDVFTPESNDVNLDDLISSHLNSLSSNPEVLSSLIEFALFNLQKKYEPRIKSTEEILKSLQASQLVQNNRLKLIELLLDLESGVDELIVKKVESIKLSRFDDLSVTHNGVEFKETDKGMSLWNPYNLMWSVGALFSNYIIKQNQIMVAVFYLEELGDSFIGIAPAALDVREITKAYESAMVCLYLNSNNGRHYLYGKENYRDNVKGAVMRHSSFYAASFSFTPLSGISLRLERLASDDSNDVVEVVLNAQGLNLPVNVKDEKASLFIVPSKICHLHLIYLKKIIFYD